MVKKQKKSAADKLNPKQRLFCELFASSEEFFGNGVQSYLKAYGCSYSTAKTNAHQQLTKTHILAYINELLEVVLNEAHADKQLAFLITQNADFGAKMAAIREFNALRQRITKKFEGTVSLAQAVHKAMTDDKNKEQ